MDRIRDVTKENWLVLTSIKCVFDSRASNHNLVHQIIKSKPDLLLTNRFDWWISFDWNLYHKWMDLIQLIKNLKILVNLI